MKVVILAGGLGTKISEESHLKPKPMIEIGGQLIFWHIISVKKMASESTGLYGTGTRGNRLY